MTARVRKCVKPLKKQGDTASEVGNAHKQDGTSSVPEGVCSKSSDVPHPDKLDDKLVSTDPHLTKIVKAWPSLPEAIRAGILAMVRASIGKGDQ